MTQKVSLILDENFLHLKTIRSDGSIHGLSFIINVCGKMRFSDLVGMLCVFLSTMCTV